MKTPTDIHDLFEKYLLGTISKEEYDLMLHHFSLDSNRKNLHELILKSMKNEANSGDDEELGRILRMTDKHIYGITRTPKTKIFTFRKFMPYVSVAILLIVGIFSYLYLIRPIDSTDIKTKKTVYDIMPGSNKAMLRLSNGEVYQLTNVATGISTGTEGIRYTQGEKIVIPNENETVSVSTPRGGQYRIVLADGTKVILNAESSIVYPSLFRGSQREVHIEGEAYLEVAHDAKKPFIVMSKGQKITVLGTRFNLYSFAGEPVTTTLLSGKVEISMRTGNSQPIKLTPGQQSIFSGSDIAVREVEASDYIGWTKDVFIFNDTKLTNILRQISRWYDVDVIFPTDFKDESFYAEIPRNRKLSEVLGSLQHSSNFRFEIQGRRIIVKQ
ncbi:DUF4974 domain-containing protein [Chryseobacterium sp. G0240]|uniref:FecR family protein n=1 Tax=Chryseobacterium sp. G0240 TaxID=2487066 RepID=UPI000F45C6E7|nr:FecR family protein [Chryseobacterium sp. G0240]ROI02520.1 DUF4974 domain-containing protein [Chryseobacterium sp. G0240]